MGRRLILLIISDKARISKWADIEESQRGSNIVIHDEVMIDSFVKIKSVGGMGDVIIGSHSYINSGCVIYSGNGVIIGEKVLIAANCTIAPVNHQYKSREISIIDQRFMKSKGGIIIEDDVWIGANCVVLDGAILRKGCVIGANSVVNGELDSYGVYCGTPARLTGYRT